jgi:hypothetical protein
MQQDLRSVEQPKRPSSPPEVLEGVPGDRDPLNQTLQAAGGPGGAKGGPR